ncbi:protein FAM214A isoform X2 [Folsomia candida]|nr:protein FAM214A isoform X2 [Folsomia candida]
MHSSVDVEPDPQEVEVELGLLIVEGRKPTTSSPKGFEEGPHIHLQKGPRNHVCNAQNHLCAREASFRKHVQVLWSNNVPLCIEVLLCSDCPCGKEKATSPEVSPLVDPAYTLLEQWTLTSYPKRVGGGSGGIGGEIDAGGDAVTAGRGVTNGRGILHAVRSFLHFSQLSAWLALSKGESPKNIMYRVTIPGENFVSKFVQTPEDHEFPTVQFKKYVMKVSVKSLPRLGSVPMSSCTSLMCTTTRSQVKRSQSPPVGEIIRGGESPRPRPYAPGRFLIPTPARLAMATMYSSGRCVVRHSGIAPVAGNNRVKQRQLRKEQRNERLLEYMHSLHGNSGSSLDQSQEGPSSSGDQQEGNDHDSDYLTDQESGSESPQPGKYQPDVSTQEGDQLEVGDWISKQQQPIISLSSSSSSSSPSSSSAISIPRTRPIPTLSEKIDFLKSLDTAATRLFHRNTGLPLTSSPAPLRKGQDRFDFDSSLVSNSRIISRFRRGCHPPRFSEATRSLLGSFEESVLNGRIEPVSTVQGFTAEIGASGSFCPRHVHLPVTVFFYTFCDNDKISTPYLAHVDLGDQGYCVPRKGTVQVTLFNPLRTVIKMFVVQFNLESLPNNSQTFLRQRTYFMPLGESDSHPSAQKWLRYLIHLRFASNQSGQIFLHTDIRMVIFRKTDADTATGFDVVQTPHELRSFTYAPHNPKFSPRFNQATNTITTSTLDTTVPGYYANQDKSPKEMRKFIPKKIIFKNGNTKFPPRNHHHHNNNNNIDQSEEQQVDANRHEQHDQDDDECGEQEYEYDFEPCKNHSEIEIIV